MNNTCEKYKIKTDIDISHITNDIIKEQVIDRDDALTDYFQQYQLQLGSGHIMRV